MISLLLRNFAHIACLWEPKLFALISSRPVPSRQEDIACVPQASKGEGKGKDEREDRTATQASIIHVATGRERMIPVRIVKVNKERRLRWLPIVLGSHAGLGRKPK